MHSSGNLFRNTARLLSLTCVLFGMAPLATRAQEGPQSTRVIVRAEGKGGTPASLRPTDVKVEVGNHDTPVSGITPLVQTAGLSGGTRGPQLEVAILLDDGLRGNFDVNVGELEKFVGATVSPTTSVGVGYMRNGSVYFPQGFSKEAETERNAVRLPISVPGSSGSPYFCLQDLLKHWPTHTDAARVVLMITNGIDLYNGSVSPLNQDSPYVDETISLAQRAAVPVYSIYFGGRGINNGPGSFSGQNYLSKVADETGGISLNQGTLTPPTITPFLQRFQQALNNSYELRFLLASRRLERLKVSSTQSGVKLRAQNQVQTAGSL